MKKEVGEDVFSHACETVKLGITTGDQTAYEYAVDTVIMLWEEQKKNKPKQIKIVFSKPLNPTDRQKRYIELKYAWKETERRRKANAHYFKLTYSPLTFEKYLLYNNIDLESYLKKPVDTLEYYSQFAKFNNHVKKR